MPRRLLNFQEIGWLLLLHNLLTVFIILIASSKSLQHPFPFIPPWSTAWSSWSIWSYWAVGKGQEQTLPGVIMDPEVGGRVPLQKPYSWWQLSLDKHPCNVHPSSAPGRCPVVLAPHIVRCWESAQSAHVGHIWRARCHLHTWSIPLSSPVGARSCSM